MFGISLFDLSWLIVALLGAGAVTGLLAGVFGVGGGAVAVPILYELFRFVGVPEEVHAGVEARVTIPMREGLRSLNVALACAIATGEALRQLGFAGGAVQALGPEVR